MRQGGGAQSAKFLEQCGAFLGFGVGEVWIVETADHRVNQLDDDGQLGGLEDGKSGVGGAH